MRVTDYELKNNEDLLFLLKDRDYAAFTEIYERFWEQLFIQAAKVLKDKQDASDVVQDVFANIWNKIEVLNIQDLPAYLFASVRYKSLKSIAVSKRKASFIEELVTISNIEIALISDEDICFKEMNQTLTQEIALLPGRMRLVYQKGKIEGLSYRQIAEELGISEKSVKTTMYRAMIQLRARLAPYLSFFLIFLK